MSCPDRCDNGWIWVGSEYVERRTRRRLTDPTMDEVTAKRMQRARVSAAENTVYPCRTCRPDDFARWATKWSGRKNDDDDPGPEPPEPPEPLHDRY